MADGGVSRDVPGGVPRQFQYEHESAETCTLLNVLGYGPHIIQARREAYKAYGRHLTALELGEATWITAGSKAEGLTSFLESDRDLIRVTTGVICLEDGVDSSNIPCETNIFRSFSRMSFPGHCRLLLEGYGSTIPFPFLKSLCEDGYGGLLLSSNLFVNEWLNGVPTPGIVQHERSGPSTPTTSGDSLHQDIVNALHFTALASYQDGRHGNATGQHLTLFRRLYRLEHLLLLLDLKAAIMNMLNGIFVSTSEKTSC